MNIKKFQKAIDEIKEICVKHNILIVGNSKYDQGMYVIDASDIEWDVMGNNVFNKVIYNDYEMEAELFGIGVVDEKAYLDYMDKKQKEEMEREERVKRLAFDGEYKVPQPFIPGIDK